MRNSPRRLEPAYSRKLVDLQVDPTAELPVSATFECLDHAGNSRQTVRARFVADGRTHLTHWSGTYKEKKIEKLRERRVSQEAGARVSRSTGVLTGWDYDEMLREEAQYFPFLTTVPGQKCSNEEILDALPEDSP